MTLALLLPHNGSSLPKQCVRSKTINCFLSRLPHYRSSLPIALCQVKTIKTGFYHFCPIKGPASEKKVSVLLDFVQVTSPLLTPIWTTCTTFFQRRNSRFEIHFFIWKKSKRKHFFSGERPLRVLEQLWCQKQIF